MVYGSNGQYSNDPVLAQFHETRNNPRKVVCIKDNPPMVGFGRKLSIGDEVVIEGTVCNELGFAVAVPAECAFYAYEYFKPGDNFFNK